MIAFIRKLAQFGFIAALMLALATPVVSQAKAGDAAASMAASYLVGQPSDCPGASYTTIQAAVTAAIANNVHTIEVCSDNSQIFEPFTVEHASGLRIVGTNPDDRPLIIVPFGSSTEIILVKDSKNVTIEDLDIETGGMGTPVSDVMAGIKYLNSTGTIKNNVIKTIRTNPPGGLQDAQAILLVDDNADGKSTQVAVQGNNITGYRSHGIQVLGPVKAMIDGNALNGTQSPSVHALFGIQMVATASGMPSGAITKNAIFNNDTAINLYDTGSILISGNLLQESTTGIDIATICTYVINNKPVNASKNRIQNNLFSLVLSPIFITSSSDDGTSQCDAHADRNMITNNDFYRFQTAGTRPIEMVIVSAGSTYSATLDHTTITNNRALDSYGPLANVGLATNTVFSGNRPSQ